MEELRRGTRARSCSVVNGEVEVCAPLCVTQPDESPEAVGAGCSALKRIWVMRGSSAWHGIPNMLNESNALAGAWAPAGTDSFNFNSSSTHPYCFMWENRQLHAAACM
jgi:hypothetical protein